MPVPLPKNYVEGIDLQWHDIEAGKPSYLRGRWQERGWWYWYLYALAVKVPLGTWGLFLLAVGVRIGNRAQRTGNRTTWRDEMVLLAPAVAVLVLVSSQTGFSRYIRYVLPMFPFVFIWISSVARFIDADAIAGAMRGVAAKLASLGKDKKRESGCAAKESGDESPRSKGALLMTLSVGLLLAWSVGSSLWYAPHWMSYFNELAGGPMGGPRHLIDAQVDWGQDLLYLKKWLDRHSEARPLGVVYFGPINPSLAGIDFVVPPKGTVVADDRSEIAGAPEGLKPGWYAVSVNFLYGYDHYIYDPSGSREWVTRPYYSYFRRFEPVATAGYSIYIYHLSASDIAAARQNHPYTSILRGTHKSSAWNPNRAKRNL